MPWARASALHRHLECPAASHLPRLERGVWRPGYLSSSVESPTLGLDVTGLLAPIEDENWVSEWGTEIHAVKAGGPDPLGWGGEHVERLWPSRLGEHEVTFSYDCATRTVELFRSPVEAERTAWKESRGDNCVTGSADWWARLPSGEPWVDDLKTGWRRPEPLTPQLLIGLVARMAQPDAAGWGTGYVSSTHWPRAKEPTEPDRDGLWRRVTRESLAAFQEEVDLAWKRATGRDPRPRPGAHCLYCPSAPVCDRANDYAEGNTSG